MAVSRLFCCSRIVRKRSPPHFSLQPVKKLEDYCLLLSGCHHYSTWRLEAEKGSKEKIPSLSTGEDNGDGGFGRGHLALCLTTLSQLLPERPGIRAHVQVSGSGALPPETPQLMDFHTPGRRPQGPAQLLRWEGTSWWQSCDTQKMTKTILSRARLRGGVALGVYKWGE